MLTLLNYFETFSLLVFLSPHKEESELMHCEFFIFYLIEAICCRSHDINYSCFGVRVEEEKFK